MYDTIRTWLPSELIKDSGYLERVPTLLKNAKVISDRDTGEFLYTNGSMLGMNVNISKAGISLTGSICKSYLQDNFKTLTRQDTERAIEQLECALNLPIQEANLSRIDIAQNFAVSQHPQSFFCFLGECMHYNRLTQPTSLYYQNSKRTKLFYNKKLEGKDKGLLMPPIWQNKHILRYELRYTSRLPKQFNKCHVKVNELYNEIFYIDMIDRWVNEYESISKNNLIFNFMNTDQVKSPNDYINQLALLAINQLGTDRIFAHIEQLKASETFKHKEYYSRLKADIRRLSKTEVLTEKSPLIEELDQKVRQVKEYYR